MIDRSELKHRGWIGVDIERTDEALMHLARSIGSPVQRNSSLIRHLRPVESIAAPQGTFGCVYGKDVYPLHTDTAFWPMPARYLVMSVAGDLRRKTHLYSWDAVFRSLGRDFNRCVTSSIWIIPVTRHSFVATMRFRGNRETGYRYDPLSMQPANPAAQDVRSAIKETLSNADPIPFDWSRYSALVVDNWQMLHGRGIAPPAEMDRTLSRIYVN